MNALLLASFLAAAPVVNTPAEPETALKDLKWEVYWGLQGGIRPDAQISGGGGSFLGVNRQIFSFLRAELAVGLGAYNAAPVDVLTMIRFGVRLEWPNLERWHPFIVVDFAHQHESGWQFIKEDPVPAVVGLSEHHVNHRSGIETGLGIAYDLRGRKGLPIGGRIGVKASVTHLLGTGSPRYVELTTMVGLIF
ncbi:MAG: hypothetical protein QM817_13215 [Archangium sp.]